MKLLKTLAVIALVVPFATAAHAGSNNVAKVLVANPPFDQVLAPNTTVDLNYNLKSAESKKLVCTTTDATYPSYATIAYTFSGMAQPVVRLVTSVSFQTTQSNDVVVSDIDPLGKLVISNDKANVYSTHVHCDYASNGAKK